jgi:hypothetical protein
MRVCVALVLLASALPAQTVLRGTVRDMDGVPLSGVQVNAQMDGTAINLRRVSQADGEFFFTLLPGAYSVTTDHDRISTTLRSRPARKRCSIWRCPRTPPSAAMFSTMIASR